MELTEYLKFRKHWEQCKKDADEISKLAFGDYENDSVDLLSDSRSINEMARINLKDSDKSPFYPGAFKVDVVNDEGNKEPHFHVISPSEGYNVRIKIKDGEVLSVKAYGRRHRTDKFTDVVKLAKQWLPLQSKAALERMTNQEFAYVQYFIMNPDSPYNK